MTGPAVVFYRVVRKWRKKNLDKKVKQEKGVEEKGTGVKKEVDDTETDGNKKTMEERRIWTGRGLRRRGLWTRRE